MCKTYSKTGINIKNATIHTRIVALVSALAVACACQYSRHLKHKLKQFFEDYALVFLNLLR